MPGVWRRQHHAHTGTSAYHLGERQYVADGHRCRDADAAVPLRRFEMAGRSRLSGREILSLHGKNKYKRRLQAGRFGGPEPGKGGTLHVVTTHMRPGYLRKNGVPYSGNAVLTEYYDRFDRNGVSYLIVTSVVDDPQYLNDRFITSGQFKREPDGSKWNPTPCRPLWPRSTRLLARGDRLY